MKKEFPIVYKCLVAYFVFALFLNYNSTSALPKIVGMLTIGIAICCFLFKVDIDDTKEVLSSSVPFYLQIVYLLTISCMIWIVDTQSAVYMKPGLTRLLYTGINITVAVCSAYVFGRDCIEYAFWGSCFYHLKSIALAVKTAGVGSVIPDFINTVMGGETGIFMSMMEVNEPTFCVGIFFMYFLFCDKSYYGKKKYIYLALSAIFLMTGFKRNICGAVALACVVGWLMKKFKEKDLKISIVVGILLAIVCFLYIPLIKYNTFFEIMNRFGINLMSRDGLYNFVSDQYDFSPFFIGRGFGFIEEYLIYVKTLGIKYVGSSLEHIHNDLLLYYIEEGFWGYIGWLVINCILYPIWWKKHGNNELCLLYTIINVYNMITYTTDNMSSSYQVTLTYRLVLMGCFASYILEKTKRKEVSELSEV